MALPVTTRRAPDPWQSDVQGPLPSEHRHVVTVAVEDFFQGATFRRYIPRRHWYRFESRIDRSTQKALDLLDEYHTQATFFVLGWVADQMPELIRQIAHRGHDIASKGYHHQYFKEFARNEFREDCARARVALERASGRRVLGYRTAHGWLAAQDLWALDVLSEEGYSYDSSVCPMLRRFASEPWRRCVHTHQHNDGALWEIPIPTTRVCGLGIPIAGGNYFRQLPVPFVRNAIARWTRTCPSPFVMYFHVWELDDTQPTIHAAPFFARVRQYRHLGRMETMLRYYLEHYSFTSMSEWLRIAPVPTLPIVLPAPRLVPDASRAAVRNARAPAGESASHAAPAATVAPAQNVSVVVPCYNEEVVLPYLANTLDGMLDALAGRYAFHFIFVDDGSTDHTWDSLARLFGDRPDCTLLRHERNTGITGALMTGVRASQSDIVCCIDCDCTYNPLELAYMIPLLTPGVDIVTASPYHSQGHVLNAPPWRLFLSRTLSRLYGMVLHQKLSTCTACFRAYRRSTLANLSVHHTGFIGIAEVLGRIDLMGGTVVEYPATLEVRLLGRSKLSLLRTVVGHLALIATLIRLRVRERPGRNG